MSRSGWCTGLGSLPCLFAIGTGEWTWAERGDAPTLRHQGWRGNAAGSLQDLLPMQWAPCAQWWKWETLWPMWRLAVSEVRKQKSDCLVLLLAASSCYTFRCQLLCQQRKNIQKTAPKSECWDSGPHPHKVWALSETWSFTTQYLDSPTSQQELPKL